MQKEVLRDAVMDPEDLMVGAGDDKEDKGKKDDGPSLSELQKEIDALKRRNQELELSEKAWADIARGKAKVPDADEDERPRRKKDPEPEEDLTPEQFVEELTKNPKGAIAKLIKGMGLVTKAEAEALAEDRASKKVRAAVSAVAEDQKLLRDYPDLADDKSEFFKKTREIFNDLAGDDDEAKRDPRMLRAAARAAKAELEKAPKKRDDDRDSRIRRQGERGRGAAADDDFEDFGPEMLSIMNKMGIKPERKDAVMKAAAKARREYEGM